MALFIEASIGSNVLSTVSCVDKSTYNMFFLKERIANLSIENVVSIAKDELTTKTMVLNVIHKILINLENINSSVISDKELRSIIDSIEVDDTEDTYDTLVAEMVELGIASV